MSPSSTLGGGELEGTFCFVIFVVLFFSLFKSWRCWTSRRDQEWFKLNFKPHQGHCIDCQTLLSTIWRLLQMFSPLQFGPSRKFFTIIYSACSCAPIIGFTPLTMCVIQWAEYNIECVRSFNDWFHPFNSCGFTVTAGGARSSIQLRGDSLTCWWWWCWFSMTMMTKRCMCLTKKSPGALANNRIQPPQEFQMFYCFKKNSQLSFLSIDVHIKDA